LLPHGSVLLLCGLQETCLELVRQDRMLEVLLGCLLGVLQRGVNAKGVVHGDSPDLAGGPCRCCCLPCMADLARYNHSPLAHKR
jgi:hypothetical protein